MISPRIRARTVLVAVLLAVSSCRHGSSGVATPAPAVEQVTGAVDVTFDVSAVELVASYLSGADDSADALARNRGIALLIEKGREDEPAFSLGGFTQRLQDCREGRCSDEGPLRLTRVRSRLDALVRWAGRLEQVESVLARDFAQEVARHLPALDFRFRRPVYFVLGGRADAYVTFVDGEPGMVVELGSIVQDGVEESSTMLRAAVVHELWHAAFLEYVQQHWAVPHPLESRDPDYALVFTMLNEGFGHYLSVLAFTGTEQAAHRLLEQHAGLADGFLAGLHKNLPVFLSSDAQARHRLVEASFTGDFLAKWGAMTGAWCVSAVISKAGRSAAVEALTRNPFDLWERCRVALNGSPETSLPPEFFDLVARLARDEDRRTATGPP